jgi:hypothetical protein
MAAAPLGGRVSSGCVSGRGARAFLELEEVFSASRKLHQRLFAEVLAFLLILAAADAASLNWATEDPDLRLSGRPCGIVGRP